MVNLTPEIEAELRRRAAEYGNASVSELLRDALDALERERAFETLVLEGLDGEEVPVTPEDTEAIRREGLSRIKEVRSE